MKMNKRALCCDECFRYIATKNASAAKLWMDLCDVQLYAVDSFGLSIMDFPAFTLLENLGFIVTTDADNIIIIKVNGRVEGEYGTYFCASTDH